MSVTADSGGALRVYPYGVNAGSPCQEGREETTACSSPVWSCYGNPE